MANRSFWREKQSFMSVWLFSLLIIILLIACRDVYQDYKNTGEWMLNVGVWIIVPVLLYFIFSRLCTTIDNKGVEISFIPFAWRKRWNWDSIGNIEVRKYDLIEFGGWGYRVGRSGVAYTCKGRYGIQMELKNGKKVLIGTQKQDEVDEFIKEIINSNVKK
ncbi:hypothetical protein [Sphingobacterium tabacisoli]|uniref:PH domain-containing protein n=1 Tax=Sphingobacterium tabacisoli TaxID=2044855 RepID=A0ABW5KVZ9_9SPHI|nr:hypothetical protein [Sphingobacterium tabacisoli]